jgi:hypothetical protein
MTDSGAATFSKYQLKQGSTRVRRAVTVQLEAAVHRGLHLHHMTYAAFCRLLAFTLLCKPSTNGWDCATWSVGLLQQGGWWLQHHLHRSHRPGRRFGGQRGWGGIQLHHLKPGHSSGRGVRVEASRCATWEWLQYSMSSGDGDVSCDANVM